jgi:hypothetical protein
MSGTNSNNRARTLRTTVPNNPPAAGLLLDGQLAVEQADPMRIWVGVPTSLDPTGRRLLYDASVSGYRGPIISDIAPTTPGIAGLWYDSVGTQLYIWYVDPTGPGQWVAVSNPPGGIADAPSDGHTYGRKNAAWIVTAALGADPADLIAAMQQQIEALTARVAALEEAAGV